MALHHEYLPATEAVRQDVVLLHGWGCNREVWRPLLTRLRPWANITLLDVPGCTHGYGSGNALELPDVLAQVLQCCPPRAVFVGWSLGGQLAVELALMAPERVAAVVTVCSNPRFVTIRDWPGMDAEVFTEFRAKVVSDPIAALQRFDSLMVGGSPQPRQLLRQLRQLRAPTPPPSTELLLGLNWLDALDQRELQHAVTQPRLHLFAEQDGLVPCEVAGLVGAHSSENSAAKVAVLPGCSHLAPLDAPQALAQHIHSFLSDAGLLATTPPAVQELEKREVAASFSRAASHYDSVAHLQRDVGEHLLTYLDASSSPPARVLDLGCGTGHFRAGLAARFPDAQYLGLDLAEGMVNYARGSGGDDASWLVADAESLPLASESVDLVFSSLALQWCSRLEHVFAELARVLRPGGRCVFTSLGPQTLCELRAAWAAVDAHQHVNTFAPVQALTCAAERIPELDLAVESRSYRMEYTRVRDLLDELKVLGAHNMNRRRPAGLTSRRALQAMLASYETRRQDGGLPATYDVIFGVLKKTGVTS